METITKKNDYVPPVNEIVEIDANASILTGSNDELRNGGFLDD